MLDLDALDLDDLSMALGYSTSDHSWWLDPETGEVELWAESLAEDGDDAPVGRGMVLVEPIGSQVGYADMEDFAHSVRDSRARDLLLRSLAGRGAFRRFKDTLQEFPALRESWFAFHDSQMRRRAVEWLDDRGLVEPDLARRVLAELPVAELAERPLDAHEIARSVADELSELYGDRLKRVVLFGSWAPGDAHPESDIDLLVVLDEVRSRREELARMSDVLWRHSLEHDTVVTELPISSAEYESAHEPLVVRARAEGVVLA